MTIDPRHTQWLEARGISAALAEKFGLETHSEAGANWLRVPYVKGGQVINHKWRLTSDKRHRMDEGAPLALWNGDCLLEPSEEPVVICEGEWDAMTALQLGWRAVSVPNGAPAKASDDAVNQKRYQYLCDARELLAKVKRFILATDGDDAGMALRTDLIALLGPARCSFIDYPEDTKDLNDILVKHGPEEVSRCLKAAKEVPVSGLYRMSDFPDEPPLAATSLGIDGLDGKFGLTPGTLTVITGYPGHGKSSLVIKMIANLLGGGSSVTIGSFETLPKPVLERRMMAALDECAEHDPTMWKNWQARRILEERLTVISPTPDQDHELDLEALLDLMEVAVMRHNTKLIVIDPWNEIEHKRGHDETETDYISRAIRGIKRFAQRTKVPVWIVAHPRKPSTDGQPRHAPCLYDLAGSANWNNKADYGLVVHRPDIEASEVMVAVTKVRMGLPGTVGRVTLRFDAARSRYGLVLDGE